MMKEVIQRISNSRKLKNVSQKTIAEALNISQAAYAKFESGDVITLERLFTIAKFLNVKIEYLLGFENNTENIEKEKDRIKILVLNALEKYESNQVLFAGFKFNADDPTDEIKFDLYKQQLKEFKRGIQKTLINMEVFTTEEIKEYYKFIYEQANSHKLNKSNKS